MPCPARWSEYSALFLGEAALEQQFDDPRAGRFGSQPVSGAQDLFSSLSCTKRAIPVMAESSVASVKWRGGCVWRSTTSLSHTAARRL